MHASVCKCLYMRQESMEPIGGIVNFCVINLFLYSLDRISTSGSELGNKDYCGLHEKGWKHKTLINLQQSTVQEF